MDRIYFKAADLYFVKPSVMTYNADNYAKLEQRTENYDIAIKQENCYLSIFEIKEYNNLITPSFNGHYINVNDQDNMLLLKYIYDNKIKWTKELSEHISKLTQYVEYNSLVKLLEEIKVEEESETIKVKKVRKKI